MKSFLKKIYYSAEEKTEDLFYSKNLLINKGGTPYISFSFDDFPASAAGAALNIMKTLSIRATYYTSMYKENKMYYGKKMFSRDDLQRVIGSGHEIGGHSYFHTDCVESGKKEILNSIQKNIDTLKKLTPGPGPVSFAYPKGKNNFKARNCVRRYYPAARTTTHGMNLGETDPHRLRASKLYSQTIPLNDNFSLIDKTIEAGGWLIFYTHDVDQNPSPYGCTEHYFKSVAEYAAASGAEVLPVGEVFELLVSK